MSPTRVTLSICHLAARFFQHYRINPALNEDGSEENSYTFHHHQNRLPPCSIQTKASRSKCVLIDELNIVY
jgi:hypothetical protein